jgi:hypothetical protein
MVAEIHDGTFAMRERLLARASCLSPFRLSDSTLDCQYGGTAARVKKFLRAADLAMDSRDEYRAENGHCGFKTDPLERRAP